MGRGGRAAAGRLWRHLPARPPARPRARTHPRPATLPRAGWCARDAPPWRGQTYPRSTRPRARVYSARARALRPRASATRRLGEERAAWGGGDAFDRRRRELARTARGLHHAGGARHPPTPVTTAPAPHRPELSLPPNPHPPTLPAFFCRPASSTLHTATACRGTGARCSLLTTLAALAVALFCLSLCLQPGLLARGTHPAGSYFLFSPTCLTHTR